MRWFHIAAIVVAAIVLLGVAAIFAYFSVMGPWDEPPPDDSDLILQRPQIPDDQNAYTYLVQAIQVLKWPGYTPPSEEAPQTDGAEQPEPEAREAEKEKAGRLEEMLDGGPWDADLAAEVLAANEETFALIEKTLACPAMQVPPSRLNMRLPAGRPFVDLASLLYLRSLAAVRAGDEAEGFQDALAITRFGHRLQHAKGTIVVFLVGSAVKRIGIRALEKMALETTLEPERLLPFVKQMHGFAHTGEALADTFRAEYEWAVSTIEELRSGRIPMENVGHPGRETKPGKPVPTSYVFKPNQTRRLFATRYRWYVESATKPLAEVEAPPWRTGSPSRWDAIKPNGLGRLLLAATVPQFRDFPARRCCARTHVGAVQALIALRCYKMREGRLPETLEALVPEYLDAVPTDDFDGKPIRYSRQKQVLYSVGEDLVDGGGFTSDEAQAWAKENRHLDEGETLNPWDLPDPSFPIAF